MKARRSGSLSISRARPGRCAARCGQCGAGRFRQGLNGRLNAAFKRQFQGGDGAVKSFHNGLGRVACGADPKQGTAKRRVRIMG